MTMTNQTTVATPAKLRSGAWGARVQGTATVGQQITIRTHAGKTWMAIVTAIVWAGAGVTLVATQSSDRPATSSSSGRGGSHRSRGTWTGCSCGSIEEYSRDSDCAQCRFDAE